MKICEISTCTNEVTVQPWRQYLCQGCKAKAKKYLEHGVQDSLGQKISKMLDNRKKSAEAKGLPFDLTTPDVLNCIPEDFTCPVFGVPFSVAEGSGSHKWSMSIDKIDPELGYVRGNIQIISKLANSMKQNATLEELEMFADWIKTWIVRG